MSKTNISVFLFALIIISALPMTADEGDWFDTEKCLYCKELAAEPGLLEHMDHELYDLERGAVSITTVSPEYLDRYRKVVDKMMVIGKEMAEGKHRKAYVCEHCEFFGLMIMQGVDVERVMTKSGEVLIMTSDDSVNVELIREYADKSRKAVERMRERSRKAD